MRETDNTADNISCGKHDNSITTRLALVTLLTFALFGAIRWAVDVTNANARRVSHNLMRMQGRMNENISSESGELPRAKTNAITRPKRSQGNAPH